MCWLSSRLYCTLHYTHLRLVHGKLCARNSGSNNFNDEVALFSPCIMKYSTLPSRFPHLFSLVLYISPPALRREKSLFIDKGKGRTACGEESV